MEMSDRTKSYVKEFTRLGPDFDHAKWLRTARAAQEQAASRPDDRAASEQQLALPSDSTPNLMRAPHRSTDQSNTTDKQNKPAKKIKSHLEQVGRAWSESQQSRQRDAIYRYLSSVFSLVQRYRERGRIKQLIRTSQQFLGLPKNKRANVYTTVIRATTHGAIDHRAVSKYARALRYCRKRKGDQSLQAFIKGEGGINVCAARYAQRH